MARDYVGHHASRHRMETDAHRRKTIDDQHHLDIIIHYFWEVTMDELKWGLLTEVQGRAEADVLKAFLIGNGIDDVELFQESLGQHIYPTNLDIFGNVQLFVPNEQLDNARKLLEEYINAMEQK
jgi:hypothetical protein